MWVHVKHAKKTKSCILIYSLRLVPRRMPIAPLALSPESSSLIRSAAWGVFYNHMCVSQSCSRSTIKVIQYTPIIPTYHNNRIQRSPGSFDSGCCHLWLRRKETSWQRTLQSAATQMWKHLEFDFLSLLVLSCMIAHFSLIYSLIVAMLFQCSVVECFNS